MTKKLLVLMVAILFIIACGKKDSTKTVETKEVKKLEKKVEKVGEKKEEVKKEMVLTADEFKAQVKDLIEKEVTVRGIAVHVCKESGKKLFLGGKELKRDVKVSAGDNVPKFDVKMEGDTLEVKGVVKEFRVDEAYIDLQIKKVKEAPEKKKEEKVEKEEHKDEAPGDDHHVSSKEDSIKQLENLRAKVKASKEGYVSFFSLEYISSKVIADVEKVEPKKEEPKKDK